MEFFLVEMEKEIGLCITDVSKQHSNYEVIKRIANDLKGMELSRTQSVRLEEVIEESERIKKQNEENRHKQLLKTIQDEYLRLLSDNKADDSDFGYSDQGYFLYDIDDNGIPELWIKSGTCEADYRILVFAYSNVSRMIYDESAGHTSFYKGENYVLKVWEHMGMTNWERLTYNGYTITETTVYAGDSTYEGDDDVEVDVMKPEEKIIKLYSLTNKQPIRDAFNTD